MGLLWRFKLGRARATQRRRSALRTRGPFLGRLARLAESRAADEAVCGQSGRLTFGELDLAAERVAAALRKLGLTAGNAVAVALPDPLDRLVACVGILRTGGAYFTSLPGEAVTPIVCGARVALLLDDDGFTPVLAPLNEPVRAQALDAGTPACYLQSEHLEKAAASFRIITHGDLAARAVDLEAALGIGAADRLLGSAAFPVVRGDLDWMLPLVLGARVKLLSAQQLSDPGCLLALVHAEAATVLQLPLEVVAPLLAESGAQLEGLRVVLAREPRSPQLLFDAQRAGTQLWCWDLTKTERPYALSSAGHDRPGAGRASERT